MPRSKPPRRHTVTSEVVIEILEDQQAAWCDMGRKIRAGAQPAEMYALYQEHAAEVALRREQAETGKFRPLSIEAIRERVERWFGVA